ncbi:MAG: MBL fold metallo-hydrolase [Chloroflexi bacterium]|nr:MBL fold metallo-hydrolase [Chloroflexota bacterium]
MDYLKTITVPTPFPVGPVNCYLVEGDELTLIDTGPIDPPTLESLRDQLCARGIEFKDFKRLIITHAHVDHFGLAAQIVAASGARVYSHPRNRWWLTDYDNEWNSRHEFFLELFAASGAPRALAEALAQGRKNFARYGASIPAENFFPLDEGDTLALNGDRWNVLCCPGHASGLIVLYESKSRELLSNDHLLLNISSNPVIEAPARGETARPRMLVDYLASFEKTARVDVRIARTGHGAPIHDTRALIAARIAFHRARLDRIEQEIGNGAVTVFEMVQRIFPRLKPNDLFLALSEIIGHLDILELDGRIQFEEQAGIKKYSPTRAAQPA